LDYSLFDDVGDALRGMLPSSLGALHQRAHRYGIKVWFDEATPPKEHYEAQVIGARHVPDATVLAIEVGFHAEHSKPADNDEVLTRLRQTEKKWRRTLGADPVAGPFLGRDGWQRLSETWADPDLGDPELAIELATRLIDYVTVLEPVRRASR
jgi:hypothetical protein